MAIFRFTGMVLPASLNMTLIGTTTAHWEDASLGLVLDTTLSVTNSVVEIVCESNLYTTDVHESEVHLRAFDMARAVVDSFAYAKGLGLSVILDTVIKPDGIKYNIQTKRPDLAALVTAFDPGDLGDPGHRNHACNLGSMLKIVFSDPLVFMALNDLIDSISLPHHAPVNCGRAIEAIRELMTPPNGNKKQGWAVVRERLNITEEYLSFITDQSKGPRHGDRKNIASAAFQETIKRSWIVMNRFLEYKKRGNLQLPLVEFPLLTN